MRTRSKHSGSLILALGLLAVQGCQQFQPYQIAAQETSSVAPLTVSPTPTATATATPTPAPTNTSTYFYFAHDAQIESYQLDSGSSTVTSLTTTSFAGDLAGAFLFDNTTGTMFAADSGAKTTLQTYKYNSTDGSLTTMAMLSYFSVVHLTLIRFQNTIQLFGAAYRQGELFHSSLDSGFSTITPIEALSYGATAHTHFSAYDSKRQLLFVTNLDLNTISIYQVGGAQLQFLNSVSVPNARTVYYDATYDKLFAVTESYSGPSYVYSFAIAANGTGGYSLTPVASLAMPLRGGDLKINHATGFALAVCRQTGQEAIYGMPLAPDGSLDQTRMSFSIPLNLGLTVSTQIPLEVTDDGQYIGIGTGSVSAAYGPTINYVYFYKLAFDANNNYVSNQKIFSFTTNNTGYQAGIAITKQ